MLLFDYASPQGHRNPTAGNSHAAWNTSADRNECEVEFVTSGARFRELRDDWIDLENAAAFKYNFFQTFDWNWRWFEAHASRFDSGDARLLIVTTRRRGRLTSVWPMMIVVEAGLRVVRWLSEPLLQYGDVLVRCAPDGAGDVRRGWKALTQSRGWSCILLSKVLGGAHLHRCLDEPDLARCSGAVSSGLDLTGFGTAADYHSSLSRSRRRKHNRRRNKLGQLGRMAFRVHTGGGAFRSAVSTALHFKQQWLVEMGLQSRSMFRPETEALLHAFADKPCGGRARPLVVELTLDGTAVAVEMGFELDRHYYAYLGAFDWALADYSPGKVQMDLMIEWCIDNGIETYDLLGTHAAYKSDWSDVSLAMNDYCYGRSMAAYLYPVLWQGRLRPWIKQQLHNLPTQRRKQLFAALSYFRPRPGSKELEVLPLAGAE